MDKFKRTFRYLLILSFIFTLFSSKLYAAPNASVKWSYVNLRESASENALIITKLVKGVNVTVLKEDDDWYQISSEEELVGWVVKRSLKVTGPIVLKKDDAATIMSTRKPQVVIREKPKAAKANEKASDSKVKKEKMSGKSPAKKELVTFSEKKGEAKAVAPVSGEPPEKSIFGGKSDSFLDGKESDMPEAPSLTGVFVRMISSLFVIIGCILLLYYFIKKYLSKSIMSLDGSSAITVLASKYIGQKTIMYVVDVMEKIVVVAISGSEITVITEISDPTAIVRMRRDVADIRENEKPFKNFFADKIKTPSTGRSQHMNESFDILDDLNEKLQQKVDDMKK